MNPVSIVFKQARWLVLLVLLASVAIVQAQTLARPTITFVTVAEAAYPSRAMVGWTDDPAAAGYEVFLRGPSGSKASNEDAWHAAEAARYHRFYGLMPGERYTFRIRAIDAEGNKSQMSKKYNVIVPSCWVFKKYWNTGEQTPRRQWGKEAPPEWAAENSPGCKDSQPEKTFNGVPIENHD